MKFGKRHMTIVIIVSVAILGAVTAMIVFQPESNITYKQVTAIDTLQVECASNFPRLGKLVDQVS
jgi:hypothetical protein